MKNFIIILHGAGGGCDYTIGCNLAVFKSSARTLESMQNKVSRIVRRDFGGDRVESWTVAEINYDNTFNIRLLEDLID